MTEPIHDHARAPMSDLLVGGDWACAEGDLGTLAHNAELLACCVAEPLRREMIDVVHACHDDQDYAGERWREAREHLRARLVAMRAELHPRA
jgi:hypothetical protein